MNEHENLGKIVANERFPIVDYKLRRGVHIAIEDVELYEFIKLYFTELSKLYRRYDADLLEGAEGYFYLVSGGTIFGQRQLSKAEMLVGLSIAHLYRDPEHRIRGTGELTVEQVISRLETLKSQEDIARIMTETKFKTELHPSKMREAVSAAIKTLAALNFIQLGSITESAFRCKRPIHRFTQFVMQSESTSEPVSNGVKS
jgi:chromosome condensin MukBEF MukE localization factor